MRVILILAVIALLMGLAGWMTINNDPGRTSINFETDKIQQDTENAVDNAERMIESGTDAISDNDEVYEQPVAEPAPADADANVRTENLENNPVVTP
jgi:Tfp pilus assembly protein PilX